MKKHIDDTQKSAVDPASDDAVITEWKNKYLRALADYQNLEKRVREERRELSGRLEESLILRLLPLVDVFDELLNHDVYKNDQGLTAIRLRFHDILQGYGVSHMPTLGAKFDPHSMECVEVKEVENEADDNTVLREIEKAYVLQNKLIRPAKVVVGKKL
ncbi:MAG: nucleotide exchange factor GrpE [bacterium]|nr:nucleotide exchange factor GrpE [bacterium]